MTKTDKILLVITVVTFVASFAGPGAEFAKGVIKPIAATAMVLFLISYIFGGEVAKYDEEQKTKLRSHDRHAGTSARRGSH